MKRIRRTLGLLLLSLAFALSIFAVACSNDEGEYKLALDISALTLDKGESMELGYTLTKDGVVDTQTEVVVTCNNDNVTYKDGKVTAVSVGSTVVTFTVKDTEVSAKATISVAEYTIEFEHDVEEANLSSTVNFTYAVRKDGLKVNDKKVNVSVVEGNDLVTYNPIGNRLTFNAVGTVKVKAELAADHTVSAVKTYNVVKSIWSSEHAVNKNAMTISEDSVFIPGGGAQQFFLGVMDSGTQYVFKADLRLPSFATDQSAGLGHTLDKNDHSLWFGLQKSSSGEGYKVLVKDYYGGWAGTNHYIKQYDNIKFDENTITCVIVRDGQDYWYSIGGLVGTYRCAGMDKPTWAGVYSQETATTVTNFSWSDNEKDIADAKALCEKSVVRFDFVNPAVAAVKGTQVEFKTDLILAPDKTAEIVWTLDKSAMTAGQSGTTIDNGVLVLAADAVGEVTVVATCGGIERRATVEILQTSLKQENDVLYVDGGVTLNDDGSVVFPEEYNSNNAALNNANYVDIYYSATLKNKVKGDFSLSFTVSDLVVGKAGYMVSIGEKYGNFFFTETGVSVITSYVNSGNALVTAAAPITATYAKADTYEVVIAVVGGHYEVTVNGTKLTFDGDPIRRVEDYTAQRNVLITTQAGTSMKVSDIELVDGADAQYIILNNNTTAVTGGFETKFIANGWACKDDSLTRTYYGGLLPDGDYTVSMNVKFSAAMDDAKFAINIGAWEYHVNNKLSGTGFVEGELFDGGWHGNSAATSINSFEDAFTVTLKRINGTMYFYIGDKLIKSVANSPADNVMSFWAFNSQGFGTVPTATVTDVTVTAGAAIISVTGDSAVQAGSMSTAYTLTVIGANASDVVWSMDDSGLTNGTASFDETAHTVTFDKDAVGSVVITVSVMGESASITVSATSQPANQNTDIAESIGGVKQDVDNGKIIFDDAALNGVADEQRYSEASPYYAILNTAANTRAVIQDNFELTFTVSDYVTTAQFPKLMISLGYKFEQFYIVYTADGARIEAFLVEPSSGNSNIGRWVNSDYFTIEDETAEHVFKLVCEDGIYSWYVDDTPISFGQANIFRSVDAIALSSNIMLSTNEGTTATVSNISLKAIEGKENATTKTYSQNFKENNDGSITATFATVSKNGRDGYHNADSVYTYGAITDNCEIVLNVKFDAGNDYPDEALLIRFGTDRSFAVVMNNGSAKIEQQWTWGGGSINNDNMLYNNTVKIKITVVNGYVTSVCAMKHDAEGAETEWSGNLPALNTGNPGDQAVNGFLSFGLFVENDQNGRPSNNTVTISNITVTPATAAAE